MVPVSMKLMGHLNWWMPAALDWIPHIREGGRRGKRTRFVGGGRPQPGQGPLLRSLRLGAAGAGSVSCGRVRSGAQRAGASTLRLGAPVGAGAAMGSHDTPSWATHWEHPRQDWGRQAAGQAMIAGRPAWACTGSRLSCGSAATEHRAWLNLRDCQVEKDPSPAERSGDLRRRTRCPPDGRARSPRDSDSERPHPLLRLPSLPRRLIHWIGLC